MRIACSSPCAVPNSPIFARIRSYTNRRQWLSRPNISDLTDYPLDAYRLSFRQAFYSCGVCFRRIRLARYPYLYCASLFWVSGLLPPCGMLRRTLLARYYSMYRASFFPDGLEVQSCRSQWLTAHPLRRYGRSWKRPRGSLAVGTVPGHGSGSRVGMELEVD